MESFKPPKTLPYPYVGGKRWLVRKVNIPPHKIYVEPFGGGLAMFWLKPPAELSVINDLDPFIFNAWQVIKEWKRGMREEVLKQPWRVVLEGTYKKRRGGCRYLAFRGENYQIRQMPDAKAFFLFLVKCWFSYRGGFGGCNPSKISKSRDWIKGYIDRCFSEYDYFCDRLNDSRVIMRNEDFRNVIKDYGNNPDVWFYLDPPYEYTLEGDYYGLSEEVRNKTNAVRPEDIVESLKNVKGRWTVSYENSPRCLQPFIAQFPDVVIDSYPRKYSPSPLDKYEITMSNFAGLKKQQEKRNVS